MHGGLPIKDVPMIIMITRLVGHKGVDLVQAVMDDLMWDDRQLVIIGTGERQYEAGLDVVGGNGIEQSAGLPDDGDGAVPHADELGQAAGLLLGGLVQKSWLLCYNEGAYWYVPCDHSPRERAVIFFHQFPGCIFRVEAESI